MARERNIWSFNIGGVQFDQHLPLSDPVVHIDQYALDGARQLAADTDRARRLQRAIRSNRELEVAATYRFGGEAG